jgi:hypothetical protein
MSYAGIIVYVEADDTPDQRVRLAANLADKFAATLIGLSALAIPPPVVADGMLMDGPTEVDIEMMKAKLVEKGNWFRSIAGADQRKVEWRFVLDFPNQALAREARSADLIVIGRMKAPGGAYNSLDPDGAILKMGCPTLVAAERVSSLRAEHVLIGWKDTRRAVQDALPFLRQASRVTIVEACRRGEEKTALARLDDVVRYLMRHQSNVLPRRCSKRDRGRPS